jgi:WD40 repeat protein
VLCGSEDDAIYIWNRHSGELLDILKEHKDTVNNIAWATQIPNFFFSCADDQTIKVWGVDKDHKVKVTIPSKFKSSDNVSENGSDMDMNPDRDSESIGDSSLSEGSVFSVSDEDL